MRRDPIPIAHTITYDRWNSGDHTMLTTAEIRARRKWCVDTFGAPSKKAIWWNEMTNNHAKFSFSDMQDVTMYLLRWDR